MNYDEILKKIIRRYGAQTDNIRMTQIIESKLKKQTATYADAEKYAQGIGKALTEALREYLPEALTDGKLHRAAAEVVLKRPMLAAGADVADFTAEIQQALNESAGIGIQAIVPEINQDQVDGIITGICNAESYESRMASLMDQIENLMEGYVDDFVHENAEFQYQAGLSPRIERFSTGKCCEWCDTLAGTYEYERVRNKGNDVFRRHRNCHCQVLFNPGDGSKRRQNVHTRQWTDTGRDDRIKASEKVSEAESRPPEKKILESEMRAQAGQKRNTLSQVIRDDPKILANYTPETMKAALESAGMTVGPLSNGGLKGIPFESGGGYKATFGGDGALIYHPAKGSHHDGEYWKVSGGGKETVRYDMDGNEK